VHPVLFEIPTPWGSQYIYSYGVMLGLSFVMGWQFVMHFGVKHENIERKVLETCFLVTALSAIAGGRLLYVMTNLEAFEEQPFLQIFNLRAGGMVAYGGFLGGAVGAAVYLRLKRVPFLGFADSAAPALAAGLACTRVGCFLYGCDFGRRLPDGAPGWLQDLGTFPRWDQFGDRLHGAPAWSYHVDMYDLSREAAHSYPVHPTQLYEVVAGLLLLAMVLFIFGRRRFRGQVILSLAMAYGVYRFLLEYVRDDPQRGEAFGFSTSQLISLGLVPVAAVAYSVMRKTPLPSAGEAPPQPTEGRPARPGKRKRK
jgi:phosphatidylglycerol:prolipoprotein diacylglycerol transferase